MKHTRIPALLLALAMALSLTACGGEAPPAPSQAPSAVPSATPSAAPTETPSAQPSAAVPGQDPIRLGLPSGLAGMGASKLLMDIDSQGEDIPYRYTLADEDSLAAQLSEGNLDMAVLSPAAVLRLYHSTGGEVRIVAAVAAMRTPDESTRAALGVTQLGDLLDGNYQLIIATVVARASFIHERPEDITACLSSYGASLDQGKDDPELSGRDMAELGMVSDAATAARAISQCQPALLFGRDMAAAVTWYSEALFQIDPALVGGGLPDDGIYFYIP